eukprot:862974-Prorocentrum_minimum.AAC.2
MFFPNELLVHASWHIPLPLARVVHARWHIPLPLTRVVHARRYVRGDYGPLPIQTETHAMAGLKGGNFACKKLQSKGAEFLQLLSAAHSEWD